MCYDDEYKAKIKRAKVGLYDIDFTVLIVAALAQAESLLTMSTLK